MLQQLLAAGSSATNTESFLAAKEAYLEVISRAESVRREARSPGYDAVIAQAQNNLAWLLATCPKTEMRDPAQAVKHARAAVAIEPTTGKLLEHAGRRPLSQRGVGRGEDALSRSMELRGDGRQLRLVFPRHDRPQAGAQGTGTRMVRQGGQVVSPIQRPDDRELYRFQVEAAERTGAAEAGTASWRIGQRWVSSH